MRASFNELNSLVKQVYQGAGLAPGLYEAAADNIVWTEAIGLEGLKLFEQQLASDRAFAECQLALSQTAENVFAVDLGDACLAYAAHLVTGLLKAQAVEHDRCVGWIKSSSPPTFLLRETHKLSQSGVHAMLVWRDHEGLIMVSSCETSLGIRLDKFSLASMSGAGAHTELLNTVGNNGTALMLVATSSLALSELARENDVPIQESPSAQISAVELESQYQHNLQNGIELSAELWQHLTILAARSLVEASEQSRRGAGA